MRKLNKRLLLISLSDCPDRSLTARLCNCLVGVTLATISAVKSAFGGAHLAIRIQLQEESPQDQSAQRACFRERVCVPDSEKNWREASNVSPVLLDSQNNASPAPSATTDPFQPSKEQLFYLSYLPMLPSSDRTALRSIRADCANSGLWHA